MEKRRVVVTGLGALTPIGNNVGELWQGFQEGRNGAGLITKFDTERFTTKFAFEIKGLDIEDHLDRKTAKRNRA